MILQPDVGHARVAVVHAKVFGGLGLRRHGFGPFGPQNQVRL